MKIPDLTTGSSRAELTEDLKPHHWGDRKLVVWVVVVLVSLTAAAFGVRPVYRHLKILRAERIARHVLLQLDAGAGTNALPEVRLMVRLAPQDELVLRAAARYCSTNQLPDAVNYWGLLLQSYPGTREDSLAFAQVAADNGRYDIATRELALLIQRPGGDVEAARMALRLALKRSSWEFAARMADHVLELAPNDNQAQLWRDLAQIRTRQPEQVEEAKGNLLVMMFLPGEHWRQAVDLLLEVPGLSRPELSLIRRRLHDAGQENLADRLRSLSADWLWEPAGRESVIAQASALLSSAQTDMDVELAGRWLLGHGAAERVLEVLPLAACQGAKGKIKLHLLALVRLGRWKEIAKVTGETGNGLDTHVATVMSVAALVVLKNEGDQQNRAQAVLVDRGLRLPDLVEAEQMAEENGLYEAAIFLLDPLLENPATMPEAANRILGLSGRVDRVSLRRRALERLVNGFPHDLLALQQLGYVEAVVPGGDLTVVERLERQPGGATNQFTQLVCALADVRQGRVDSALARLDALAATSTGQLRDYRVNLVYAAAYGTAGNNGEARRHAALADRAPLQSEERDLVSPWLPR